MSALSQLLRDKAEEIRISSSVTESAVEFLKQAGVAEEDARLMVDKELMEKEATEVLMSSGVDAEKAVAMVKAANIDLKAITTYQPSIDEAHPSVELLKQAAAYIDALESELTKKASALDEAKSTLDDLTDQNGQAQEKIASLTLPNMDELPEQIKRASETGNITFEELRQLQGIEPELLNKLASISEAPWGMGSAAGPSQSSLDPLSAWVLS